MKDKIYMALTISYYGDQDPEIDKFVQTAMKKKGYRWYAGGYNFMVNKRDLLFEREVRREHINRI